jgi:hypothetical protein
MPTVKVLVLALLLGVPLMTPFGDKFKPAGSEPPVTVHV